MREGNLHYIFNFSSVLVAGGGGFTRKEAFI